METSSYLYSEEEIRKDGEINEVALEEEEEEGEEEE